MEGIVSNKKMIRQIKKLIDENENATFLGINKKGKYIVTYNEVTKTYTFPLTPSNTEYPIKEVKKILKKVA
tara:strand:- start:382 stop:594 length:213 start_codon:yes stop_codon:yes gene_type:complete